MLKQITLVKAHELYNKGFDIYLLDKEGKTALGWNSKDDSGDFTEILGYYGEDVLSFIVLNSTNTSNI